MRLVKLLILPIITLLAGILLGILIRDFPKFTIDYHLKITDVLSILVTLGIGLFIPLIVKKLIEDRRSFKNSLISEVDSFSKMLSKINDKVAYTYEAGKIIQRDKDELNFLFETVDGEFNLLFEFLKKHSNNKTKKELDTMKSLFIEYWKTLTGTEIMKSSIKKISESTYKRSQKQYNDLKASARDMKAQLNDL